MLHYHPAWTFDDIDAIEDGRAQELLDAHVGWAKAQEFAQKRHARQNAPSRDHSGRKPIYGMRGHYAPQPGGE